MTTYTSRLRLTLQETGENDSTWGDVANAGVFQLLEDALSLMVSVSLTAGSVVLSATNGATDQARAMILDLTGTLGAARDVTVPSVSKVYVVRNSTSGSQTVTVKTAAGTGIVIPDASTIWIWCDGTDCYGFDVSNAATADVATSALDADALNGIAASFYARLDQGGTDQSFSRSQSTTRQALTAGASVAVNANLSNSFYLQPNQNFTLSNPTGGVDGSTIRIAIQQPGGANYAITWGSAYKFAGGVQPTLTAANGAIDYFSFEKLTTNVWIGGGLLDLS